MRNNSFYLAVFCLFASSSFAPADIISNFNADLDGWTTDNSGTFQHEASGGNPGGYLFLDNDEGPIARLIAPSKFLGDLSAYDGGQISFDGNLLEGGGTFFDHPEDYGVIEITGTAGTVSRDLLPGGATPALQSWNTYSASLDASSWGVSEAQWTAVLADVTSIRISVESLFGAEMQGIDNVRISAVPEPGGLTLMGLGMSFFIWRRKRIA